MAKKTKDLMYYEAVGRRKEAVARARLYIVGKDKTASVYGVKQKQGTVLVNKLPLKTAYPSLMEQKMVMIPFAATQTMDRFVVTLHTEGGGHSGQIQAIIHALSRAIEKTDSALHRPILKHAKLLTRDARTRERRKVGMGGKARRAKQSPKR